MYTFTCVRNAKYIRRRRRHMNLHVIDFSRETRAATFRYSFHSVLPIWLLNCHCRTMVSDTAVRVVTKLLPSRVYILYIPIHKLYTSYPPRTSQHTVLDRNQGTMLNDRSQVQHESFSGHVIWAKGLRKPTTEGRPLMLNNGASTEL